MYCNLYDSRHRLSQNYYECYSMHCLAMNSQEDLLLKDEVNSRITRDNRKRRRNAEDESSEFMPLSKRINNLHINNLSGMQVNMTEDMDADWSNKTFLPSPNYSDLSQGSLLYDGCSSSQSSYTAEYKPGLDAFENPFYYESNKLLFTLYMERVQRTSDSF
ncbi:uncharacterized protein LOC144470447 [Augochlora pura]